MNSSFQEIALCAPQNTQTQEIVATEDTSFSYDGYQVVRGEFFAHLFEPSVTLNNEKVSVNAACIRRLPQTDYVQFLVNPKEKKLVHLLPFTIFVGQLFLLPILKRRIAAQYFPMWQKAS